MDEFASHADRLNNSLSVYQNTAAAAQEEIGSGHKSWQADSP
jgi:hypothetical protein